MDHMLTKVSLQQLFDKLSTWNGRLLALDPGETTGYTFITNHGNSAGLELSEWGQLDTKTVKLASQEIEKIFDKIQPTHVVFESYRIYGSKAATHINAELIPVRVVGIIEHICNQRNIPYTSQGASLAKQFCTDDKLKTWNFWFKNARHARDAMRHAVWYILFSYPKLKKEGKL